MKMKKKNSIPGFSHSKIIMHNFETFLLEHFNKHKALISEA